jgi:RNA polymerase sigma factor (sigma-70 family)
MTAVLTMKEAILSDAEEPALAQRFAAGDSLAFEQVVACYQCRLARLTQRLLGWRGDHEDVVQDVFVIALDKCRSFRSDSSLWTWLATIAINRCRRRLRRQSLLRRLLLGRAQPSASFAPAADASSLDADTARHVRAAVAALPAKDREVIVLHYLEQCPVTEMSEVLGASIGAIQVRLHRARTKLGATLAPLMTEK